MAVAPAPLTVSFLSLGWRPLTRDWRAGELRLLLVAVTLAVAALTAVGFFADRLQGGLARDARALIGGDAVVSIDNPTPPPLRGSLRVADGPQAPDAPTRDIPAPGTAWVDAALLVALDLQVGSPLLMGDSQFRIGKVIVVEPDRGAGFLTFAPRVMINAADLPATGLVQPASRLTYRLAVAGNDPAVKQFVQCAQAQIEMPGVRGLRLESLEGGQPAMQQTLERAEKFLNLVALLAALLSAVAVTIAARGFAQRHLDDCAMLRVLGLSQG